MNDTSLTLADLLDSRENRVNHQLYLLEKYDKSILISMTLNIPGPVKDNEQYRKALGIAIERLKAILDSNEIFYTQILHEEFRPLKTGPEGYLVVSPVSPDELGLREFNASELACEIKKLAIKVEEEDSLGRLFDIDILYCDEQTASPLQIYDIKSVSRSQLNAQPRQCLICGEDAKSCARSRRHDMGQLLSKIDEILLGI